MKNETAWPQSVPALQGIAMISLLAVGTYPLWASALVSVLLTLWLWRQGRALCLRRCISAWAVGAVWLFYGLSSLWAVDGGLALWGAAKYLPLPLWALCMMALPEAQRRDVTAPLPLWGAGMTVLSALLSKLPALAPWFLYDHRLGGFFQYPNTFGCFLLLGWELLLLKGEKWSPRQWAEGALLLWGILLCGSRTVFLLWLPATLWCLAAAKDPRRWQCGGICIALGAGLYGLWSLISGAASARHMVAITPEASTLLGRLLYWRDALPVILRHPFGLGYLGYYMTQSTFQSGVYAVRWVHNDLLQLLLDVGWLPAALAVWAVSKTVLSRRTDSSRRILLVTLVAHAVTDFDLEYISMYLILLSCLSWDGRPVALPRSWTGAAAAVTTAAAVYLGAVTVPLELGQWETALRLYPGNTLAGIELLHTRTEPAALDALAQQLLARNDALAVAWDARAEAAFYTGDYNSMILCKRQAILLDPYDLSKYEDYFRKLCALRETYLSQSDAQSAAFCLEELAQLQTHLDAVAAKTHPLAYRIADRPQLEMPREYREYLENQK